MVAEMVLSQASAQTGTILTNVQFLLIECSPLAGSALHMQTGAECVHCLESAITFAHPTYMVYVHMHACMRHVCEGQLRAA